MAQNTSSTAATNGSAKSATISSTTPPCPTPAQVAEDTALSAQRIDSFMSNTASYPPYFTSRSTSLARTQTAARNIQSFDTTFNSRTGNNARGNDVHDNASNNSNNCTNYKGNHSARD